MSVQSWVDARQPTSTVHLDVAACGRPSRASLQAQTSHLLAEADGGYVAEVAAEPALNTGRAALAGMVALAGSDVAFCDSGSRAFELLMAAWPLSRGARVGTAGSEFGRNAAVLVRLAAERGWDLVQLPADALGRIVDIPRNLDLITFPQVASHRGVEQPVDEAIASGVPLILDVAQALGQCVVPPGAAAYVGTSRKWLCGPRGVGFVVAGKDLASMLRPSQVPGLPDGIRRFESPEANIAGRAGLAVAAGEWSPELLSVLHGAATLLRCQLADVPGWSVVEPTHEPTGITTLQPLAGQDPDLVRRALLARGILVSAVPTTRAADLTAPVLRISTGGWVTEDDGLRCAVALAESGGPRG